MIITIHEPKGNRISSKHFEKHEPVKCAHPLLSFPGFFSTAHTSSTLRDSFLLTIRRLFGLLLQRSNILFGISYLAPIRLDLFAESHTLALPTISHSPTPFPLIYSNQKRKTERNIPPLHCYSTTPLSNGPSPPSVSSIDLPYGGRSSLCGHRDYRLINISPHIVSLIDPTPSSQYPK